MPPQSVLDLQDAIQNGLRPLQWWEKSIFPMSEHDREIALAEISDFLVIEIPGISDIATALVVDKFQYPELFHSILFEFLFPIHAKLVATKKWNGALNLEAVIYSLYIKQDENSEFYEKSFGRLYAPYRALFSNQYEDKTPANLDSGETLLRDKHTLNEKTLFWFQTYTLFAHTNVVLEFAESIDKIGVFYASALDNTGLNESKDEFQRVGIEILSLNEQLDFAGRCKQLIEVCYQNGIKNIVFVSLPLQSGFLRTIAQEIKLTWWSMKYPLGCMPHFDRLICNRSLIPEMRIINGAQWSCGPFATKALPSNSLHKSINQSTGNLKVGVLSRTEKFGSSPLPEIISTSLLMSPTADFFWTGRTHDHSIEKRLQSASPINSKGRIKFCGWVEPFEFLSNIDVLVDTPNLGGLVAYWAMSMEKVVLSATDSGSIGALGSRAVLSNYFRYLETPEDVSKYFSSESSFPFYLASLELIPLCIKLYAENPLLLKIHGARFLSFFDSTLSNLDRWGNITYQMLQGEELN